MQNKQAGFDWREPENLAAPVQLLPQAAALASRLQKLATQGIYLGTSSWKYPGWLGKLYTPERYFSRRKFSPKKFERECLAEYAAVFPTVSGDFAFYQFPSTRTWKHTFDQVPEGYRFSLKIPEEVTVERYPVDMVFEPNPFGHVWTAPARPAYTVKLRNRTAAPATVELELATLSLWLHTVSRD